MTDQSPSVKALRALNDAADAQAEALGVTPDARTDEQSPSVPEPLREACASSQARCPRAVNLAYEQAKQELGYA